MRPPRRLSVPLESVTLPILGADGIRVVLPTLVRVARGRYIAVEFRVDTAADFSEVGVAWARTRRVPITGTRKSLPVVTGAGTVMRTGWFGTIRLHLPTWSGNDFEWPCFFRENRPVNLPLVLSLGAIINDLRLIIDGTPDRAATSGRLYVEDR